MSHAEYMSWVWFAWKCVPFVFLLLLVSVPGGGAAVGRVLLIVALILLLPLWILPWLIRPTKW